MLLRQQLLDEESLDREVVCHDADNGSALSGQIPSLPVLEVESSHSSGAPLRPECCLGSESAFRGSTRVDDTREVSQDASTDAMTPYVQSYYSSARPASPGLDPLPTPKAA